MKRPIRKRRIGLFAWLLGVLVPLAGLTAFLTFSKPVNLIGPWPLGIGTTEVEFYARWLDLRDDGAAPAKAERYLFSSAVGQCPMDDRSANGSLHWFEADGFGDSVRVRRSSTMPGAIIVGFRGEEIFRGQREILLAPAKVGSIRAKYLQLLAEELGLMTPEVSFVRVIACGIDQGIHMKMERLSTGSLERNGLMDASLFRLGHDPDRPEHLHPMFEEDTLAPPMPHATLQHAYAEVQRGDASALSYLVDADAAVALLLMEWIAHGDAPFRQEHLFAYDHSKGRAIPVYHQELVTPTIVGDGPVLLDFLTVLLRNGAVREKLSERRTQLLEERWRMKERFAAMDRAWLPILAEGGSLAFAQATALRIQEELLGERLDKEDPLAMLDVPVVRPEAGASTTVSTAAPHYWPSADDPRTLERIAQRTKARASGDTLTFPRGRFKIEEDLTIPYGYVVVLEQGARFEIAPGRSVIVQGPLVVRGTARNPVFVRPLDEGKPFGTFAVLGDGTTRCVVSGLQLSGGSGARVNGVHFSGAFAVHYAAATILTDCVFSSSHGDDLVNIKDGSVELRDLVFEDGSVDLLDLDRCTGSIAGCIFRNGRKDATGDGLEVSGARILVSHSTFTNMANDGISLGEASQLLVRGSRFEHNRTAIAAKDLSIAFVEGNTFLDNGIVFSAYRMKPIYGGAQVMRYANEYVGNGKEQEVDALSAIMPQEQLEAKVLKAFGAE
ncbi:MAG: right-handed parallel beta-helix repeat-containing protein [Flavobacteriales bacterium]|nr:right-handed parallel beta-helix repeat-containing protein [Flavobacteriales bacterium]